MNFSILESPLFQIPSSLSPKESNPIKFFSKKPFLSCKLSNPSSRKLKLSKISLSCFTIAEPLLLQPSSVSQKVQSLNFEFKSLPEPIDRVKKLLYHGALLPPFDECLRIQENQVKGCTARVWLDVKMDKNGVVRFRIDSDSEIVKGFCSCLIWVLDGAEADEVLRVKSEDLVEMNIGLPGNSRVNAWHNVLSGMQKRTRDLIQDVDENRLVLVAR